MASRRPNILLIVTDQQRLDTVGAHGSPVCRTPSMDRLAAEGLRFDNAFTPCGLCSPVRCSLLSGLYPHGHQVLTNVSLHPIRASLHPKDDRLTPMLKAKGYRLGCVGKWHVNDTLGPIDFGFDDHHSLADYLDWRRARGIPIPDAMLDYTVQRAELDPAAAEKSRPAWLVDRAIELVERYATATDERPWLLRLDFHGPHFPNVVPEPYRSMYDPAAIPPWPNAFDPLDGKPAVQRIKQRHWRTDRMSWADWQPLIAAYFGEITLIDAQVGRLLAALDTNGLQDTLVIWTTDHGDTIGAHGICNKDYTMYEEIYRVPLLVRWPGVIAPGGRTDAYAHHFLDLFATFHDLLTGAVPTPCHGRSLLPVLRGETSDGPRQAYCEFHGSHMGLYSMRLLRDDRYSYVYHTNDIDELYDHATDPHQLTNLVADPAAGEVLADMKRRMVDWMARTDDHLHNEWTVLWLTDDPELAARAPGRRRTKW